MAGRELTYGETMRIEALPAVPVRDSSGGIVDTEDQWSDVSAVGSAVWDLVANDAIPCHVHQLRPQQMMDFAEAGYKATHEVCTERAGILAGQRLVLDDGTILRVVMAQHVRGKQDVDPYYRVIADEVRLQ